MSLYKQIISSIPAFLNKFSSFGAGAVKFLFDAFLLNILNLSVELGNLAFLLILFYSCLFNLLKSSEDKLQGLLEQLPGNSAQLSQLSYSFKRSLQGIYTSSVEMFCYHTLVTWIFFDFCSVNFGYLLSFVAGCISLFPTVSPLIVLVPADLLLFFRGNTFGFIEMLLMNVLYAAVLMKIDNDIYDKNVEEDPYLTGLSVLMGIYAFGIKGIIYGPLLLCFSTFARKVLGNVLRTENQCKKGSEKKRKKTN